MQRVDRRECHTHCPEYHDVITSQQFNMSSFHIAMQDLINADGAQHVNCFGKAIGSWHKHLGSLVEHSRMQLADIRAAGYISERI